MSAFPAALSPCFWPVEIIEDAPPPPWAEERWEIDWDAVDLDDPGPTEPDDEIEEAA